MSMVVQEGGPALARAARRAGAAQVLLNGRFGDANVQFEQLTTDAFSAPCAVDCGHLADEHDGLGCDGWPMCRCGGTRLSAPEAVEQVAMPAQQGIGLYNEQALAPGVHTAGEQDQQGPVNARAARALGTPSQDDQLLSKERVLGDELRLAAGYIGQRAGDKRSSARSGGDQQATEWVDAHDELFLHGSGGRSVSLTSISSPRRSSQEGTGQRRRFSARFVERFAHGWT